MGLHAFKAEKKAENIKWALGNLIFFADVVAITGV